MAPAAWRGGCARPPQGNRVVPLRRHARKDVSKSGTEVLELVVRADGDANRGWCAEPVKRADDHALTQQLVEHRAPVTDLEVHEVAARRADRIQTVVAKNRFEERSA